MRAYVVWLSNKTDRRDDEWRKVRAATKQGAKLIAQGYYDEARFCVSNVYTLPELKMLEPWIHSHEWGRECVND
jgi:argininosuccinate synthase